MATRDPTAGGFFWMAAIVAGTAWGIWAGEPMKGVLAGTLIGAAIAIGFWLAERYRR